MRNVSVGYTESIGYQCSVGRAGISNDTKCQALNVTQQPINCTGAISLLNQTENLSYKFSYINTGPRNLTQTWQDLFTNSRMQTCPLMGCQIHQTNCSGTNVTSESFGNITIGTSPKYKLEAALNIKQGYYSAFSVQCMAGVAGVSNHSMCKDVNVNVTELNCQNTTSLLSASPTNFTLQYTKTSSSTIIGDMKTFFNSSLSNCPITNCILKQNDCKTDYNGSFFSLTAQRPFAISAQINRVSGYSDSACLNCTNYQEGLNFDEIAANFTVTQIQNTGVAYYQFPSCMPYCLVNNELPANRQFKNDTTTSKRRLKTASDCFIPIRNVPYESLNFNDPSQVFVVPCLPVCSSKKQDFVKSIKARELKITKEISEFPLTISFKELYSTVENMPVQKVIIENYLKDDTISYSNLSPAPQIKISTSKKGVAKFTYAKTRVTLFGCAVSQQVRTNLLSPIDLTLGFFIDCSLSKVNQKNTRDIELTRKDGAQKDANVKFDYLGFYTSESTNCPLTFSLKQVDTNKNLEKDLAEKIIFRENKLVVSGELQFNTLFTVVAQNIRGIKVKNNFIVKYNEPEETLAPLINQKPYIKGRLQKKIEINVVKKVDGTMKNSKVYEYRSPPFKDQEQDKIDGKMFFSNKFEAISFKKFESKEGPYFMIFIDRSKVTKPELTLFNIEVGDKKHPKAIQKQIQIEVTFLQKVTRVTTSVLAKNITASTKTKKEMNAILSTIDISQLENTEVIQKDLEELQKVLDTPIESTSNSSDSTPISADEKAVLYEEKMNKVAEIKNDIEMKSSGFTEDASIGGYVFPGVDVSKLKRQMANSGNFSYVDETEPQMRIGAISSQGEIEVDFNIDMVKPEKIDQKSFNKAFRFRVKSAVSGTTVEGKFENRAQAAARRLTEATVAPTVLSEEEDWQQKLAFHMEITNYDPRKIKMKMHFVHEDMVSGGSDKDQVIMNILNPALFMTEGSLKRLTSINIQDGGNVLKDVPPIIDKEVGKTIVTSTRRGGQIMNSVSSGNFIISLILGGSMQQLWGMIRAMQTIVLNAVIIIPTPAHTFLFMSGCMMFAQMDVMDGAGIFENLFVFKDTDPLNPNFELFGMGDKNFMMNSGSFFIFQLGIVLFKMASIFFNFIAIQNPQNEHFRQLGMRAYDKDHWKKIKWETKKLFLESYFDICLCAMINCVSFYTDQQYNEGLKEFFQTPDDIMCSTITIVYTFLILVFPIIGYFGIIKHINKMGVDPNLEESVSVFIQDNKTNTQHRALYNIYFMGRRFFIVVILLFMDHLPYFQSCFMTWFSLANLCYLVTHKPLEEGNSNEIFNEGVIYIVCILMMNFLDIAQPDDFRNIMGYVVILVGGGNIFINMGLTIKETINDCMKTRRRNKILQEMEEKFEYAMHKRLEMTKNYPEDLKDLKEQMDLIEAVKYCKEWHPHRKWLLKNDMNIHDFPQEIKFQEYATQHMMYEKAYRNRLRSALQFVAREKAIESTLAKKLQMKSSVIRVNRLHALNLNLSDQENSQQSDKSAINLTQNMNDVTQSDRMIVGDQSQIISNKKEILTKPFPTRNKNRAIQLSKINDYGGLKQITEQSIEQHESIQTQDDKHQDEPTLHGEYKAQMMNIYQSDLLKNQEIILPELEDDLNEVTMMKMRQIQGLEKDTRSRKKVERAIKSQEFLTGSNETNPEKLKVLRECFEKQMNVDFLLDESDSDKDYGEEIMNIFDQDGEQIAEQLDSKTIIKPMLYGGQNDYIQAVLQCLVELEPFVKFFLTQEFSSENKSSFKDQLLCTAFHTIFTEVCKDQIELLKKYQLAIDVQHFETTINQLRGPNDQDDAIMLLNLINERVVEETDMPDSLENSTLNAYMKILELQMHRQLRCKKNSHINTSNFEVDWKILVKNAQTVQLSLDNYLLKKDNGGDKKCFICDETELLQQTKFVSIPEYLILIYSLRKKKGGIQVERRNLDAEIDIKKYVRQGYTGCTKLELFGIIDCDNGSVINSTQYQTFVKKTNKTNDHKFWVNFHGGTHELMTQRKATALRNPQILFYRRVDETTEHLYADEHAA